MCLKSKCCNAKTRKDQVGVRRCTFCLLPAKLNFHLDKIFSGRTLFVILLSTIVFPQSWYGIQASAQKQYMFSKHIIQQVAEPFKDVELKDSCIIKELIADSCIIPSVAIAQAHIESAYYTSTKTFTNKNLFGIKPHKCKYVKGVNNYQAVYDTYKDNIACYCEIQKSYLNAINGHYAQNPAYVGLIKQMK